MGKKIFDFKCKGWDLDRFGLNCQTKTGIKGDRKYEYMNFIDQSGKIKWKITHDGNLHLFHRSKYGKGLHSQTGYAWATKSGLFELITVIKDHEIYERNK